MSNSPFTKEEDAVLLANRGKLSAAEIGRKIGRSADAVRRRWRNLGLTATKPLTDAEKRKLALVGKTDAELIQLHLQQKGVTVCPPALATGLGAYEQATGFTAQPAAHLSYRERQHQQIQAHQRRHQQSSIFGDEAA
ncbi:AsnC family protein [Phenylobacterium sp. VNQ135]|uniref:AsnC family protein n=1 Tax=Phenylobacterium sp. VNQ135 TaxID=3400922 RepID=UPI003C026CE1